MLIGDIKYNHGDKLENLGFHRMFTGFIFGDALKTKF